MPKVAVPRDRIADGSLPPVCVVCGATASHRRLPGLSAPSLAWVFLSPLFGLIAFWGYVFFAELSAARTKGGFPFCDSHRRYWATRAWVIFGGFLFVVLLLTVGAILTETPPAGKKDEPHWMFGVGACWMLLYLPTFIILHLTATRPIGGKREAVILAGASRQFADAMDSQGRELSS